MLLWVHSYLIQPIILIQKMKDKALQQANCIVNDVNILLIVLTWVYRCLIQPILLIQHNQDTALKRANCVVTDVSFHIEPCSYGYKAA